MLIFSPVFGLRPSRALCARTTKLPNGVSATRSPLRSAPSISSKIASTSVAGLALGELGSIGDGFDQIGFRQLRSPRGGTRFADRLPGTRLPG